MSLVINEAWLPPELDREEFMSAFRKRFPNGKIEHIPLVPDAHPSDVPDGWQYFQPIVPAEQMGDYHPFFKEYAEAHGYGVRSFLSSSGFGFSHSG